MQLRPYQENIVAQIRDSLRRGGSSPLVVAPTGSGKTAIFSHIAAGARARRNRVLVLVHRREILTQTLRSMHRLGITAGQITAGRPMTRDLVQVASVQTLVRRLSQVPRPDLIITDEAHHTTEKNTWGRIHNYWSTVPNIGFTATPERLDGVGLGESYDEMIQGPTIRELVDGGWLSFPVLYRPPNEIDAQYHIKRGDFDQAEQQEVMSRRAIVGDVIAHYKRHMDGAPVIVSCVSVQHAHLMAETFRAAGYRAQSVWGNMPQVDRDRAINGLGDGSVQVVTFADLIGEGVDVPIVSGVIMLRRTLSLALYLQIVGRALRPYPGKERAVILDHAGNYAIHGHVLADREWSLDSQKRTLKNAAPPTTTACPKCYGVWPGKPKRCPACGFEFKDTPAREQKPLKVIAGELVEAGIPGEEAEDVASWVSRIMGMDPKKRQAAMIGRAFAMVEAGEDGRQHMAALAKAVGYKESWSRWAWEYAQKNRRGA